MPNLFIGRTGLIETTLRSKAARLRERLQRNEPVPVDERRWLFTGPPGTGKTSLGWLAARLVLGLPEGSDKFNHIALEHLNGAGVTVDVVREWTAQSCYKPLVGETCVKFVDEVDALSDKALTDIRTYLDELANHRLFIATTNLSVDQLQPQLQSRFQVFRFHPIPAEEIAGYLSRTYGLDVPTAQAIAQQARGNVRAAQIDTRTELDVRAAFAQAA